MQRRDFLTLTLAATGTLASGLIGVPAWAAEAYIAESEKFIRDLADTAIHTLTDKSLDKEQRRQKFRDLFNQSFAVKDIALYVLGRYHKRATEAELAEYLQLFEDVIVNTWADRFTDYAGQKFDVTGATSTPSSSNREKTALVSSVFNTDPNSPVDIEWRVATNGTIYKITDVKVSGLSLAKTQQDEFGSVIRANGNNVSALIDKLREMRKS